MRSRLAPPLCLLLLILTACQVFSQIGTPDPVMVATGVAGTLTALAPGSTPSPAPTLQMETPTPEATLTPTPFNASPTPEATLPPTPDNGLPPPAAVIPQPAVQTTLILLGSDQRPKAPDFRTDIMVVVVLKTDGSVSLISFPRDLWVYLPGRSMQRINTAQEFGGFRLLQSTFQYNFGFSPQSYILTSFNGFQNIVNGLGGIDFYASRDFHDARTGFYPQGYTVKAGPVHMDGETALWYVRARQTTGELDRSRRSQEVLVGIGLKLLSLNGLARIPQLYSAFRGSVVTDLTLQDTLDLLPMLQTIDTTRIQRYAIGKNQVIPYIIPTSGADVLLPRPDAIRQLLLQAMGAQ